MDREDINLLRLMEEVGSNSNYSQRELARKLNLSLGLVNTFIKRLVNKGYFKVTTLPRNRVKYLLTPKGMAQKSKLTVEYLRYSVNFYKSAKGLILNTYQELEQKNVQRLIFFGGGEIAELAYLYLQLTSIELVALVDRERVGERFFGITVESPERLKVMEWDAILVTQLDDTHQVIGDLINLGIPEERIVTL